MMKNSIISMQIIRLALFGSYIQPLSILQLQPQQHVLWKEKLLSCAQACSSPDSDCSSSQRMCKMGFMLLLSVNTIDCFSLQAGCGSSQPWRTQWLCTVLPCLNVPTQSGPNQTLRPQQQPSGASVVQRFAAKICFYCDKHTRITSTVALEKRNGRKKCIHPIINIS